MSVGSFEWPEMSSLKDSTVRFPFLLLTPIHRWVSAWVLVLGALIFSGHCHANTLDLVTERAWLEDTHGTLTWHEVQKSEAWQIKSDSPVINVGYGSGVIWFRLRIDPSLANLPADAKLGMRIRPAYLDDLILFDPLQSPAQQPGIGDQHHKDSLAKPSPALMYTLPAGANSRHVWVRLKSTSTRMAHIEVMDEASMEKSNWRLENFGALYLSVLFVFIAWGVIQLTMQRDGLVITFVIYQIFALLFGTCLFGYTAIYARLWLSPATIDLATSALAVSSTLVVSLFANQLLDTLKKSRWRLAFNTLVVTGFVACLLLIAYEQVRTALQLNMTLIFILPIVYWFIAVFTRQDKQVATWRKIPRAAMITYFSVTLAITLLASLPALKLMPASEFSHYVVSLYSVCSGLLMMMVIQYRSVQTLKERSLLAVQAQQAYVQVAQERQFRQETEQLLTMLGHELNTPLSTLLIQVNDPQIPVALSQKLDKSVGEMSHIIERTIQVGQLEHKKLALDETEFDFPNLVQKLVLTQPEATRIQTEIAPIHAHTLKTDVYLLTIVIRNLLDNALKYSPEGSMISVHLRQSVQTSEWRLTVSNSPGRAGWPDPSRLFEKYYRSPAANYRSGTGLGLFLIRSLAEHLGFRVEYQPNEHSIVFHLVIPAEHNASA